MTKSKSLKLGIFIVFVVSLFVIKLFTPLGDSITIENLQQLFVPLGAWGIILYIVAFCIAIILQLPGIIFIAATIPIFGVYVGPFVAYFGSVAAIIVSFYFARSMGGNVLEEIKNKRIRKVLENVERAPFRTIVILRLLIWVSPPLNYALAFSKVNDVKYIWASAVGLILPVAVMTLGYQCLFG